jgi:hypothetical protein
MLHATVSLDWLLPQNLRSIAAVESETAHDTP